MIYDITHRTEIDYAHSVSEAHHILHLMPRNFARQQRVAFVLNVTPQPSVLSARDDYFGNATHHLTLIEPHQSLEIESRSRVEVRAPKEPIDLTGTPAWESVAAGLARADAESGDAQQFVFDSPHVSASAQVRDFACQSFTPDRPLLDAAFDLTRRIFDEFEYQGGVSDVSTPVAQVLAMKQGVCQDFAHLQIACLRSVGLAVRYVSGYLLTHPKEGEERLVGADASHAWISVWAGEAGWVDFDPTNGLMPGNEHITIAWGRDFSDVSPNNGFIVGGGAHEVSVGVDVVPVP